MQYKDTISKCQTTSWFSVENMTDLQNQKQEHKRKRLLGTSALKCSKNDTMFLKIEVFSVTYDPPGDGNCQFSAIYRIVNHLGF